jgi:hypothetical protein
MRKRTTRTTTTRTTTKTTTRTGTRELRLIVVVAARR